ncbi:hypothetical protein AVEN_274892-1, partial [Araneus ventricosus]
AQVQVIQKVRVFCYEDGWSVPSGEEEEQEGNNQQVCDQYSFEEGSTRWNTPEHTSELHLDPLKERM